MMLAHLYDEKIDVTRNAGTTNSDGFTPGSWTDHLTNVPCKIEWSKGTEQVIKDRITSSRDAKIFTAIRDITENDRIEFESVLYDIVSVRKPGNRFMIIDVKRNTEEALA